MTSIATLTLVIFLFFITITDGEKGKQVEKIIIHVPYKIHKHHHTHTKYKIITIPAPKKESTVIYLKNENQPEKQIPAVQMQPEVIETEAETPEPFIPPHQQSAAALLDSIANHKETNIMPTGQHYYETIVDDQKPLESFSNQNIENFTPNFNFKPKLLPHYNNRIPNFSYKPLILPQQNMLTPKLLFNPIMHHSFRPFFPKFMYQPVLPLLQEHLNFKHAFRPIVPPPNSLQDSAHTSSQIYKSVIPLKPRATSYKVKEENEENYKMHAIGNQHSILHKVPVPPMKSFGKGKNFRPLGPNYQLRGTRNVIHDNPDYEYEHVGYLIIDGNSRKVVGKNFKDEIHLST